MGIVNDFEQLAKEWELKIDTLEEEEVKLVDRIEQLEYENETLRTELQDAKFKAAQLEKFLDECEAIVKQYT